MGFAFGSNSAGTAPPSSAISGLASPDGLASPAGLASSPDCSSLVSAFFSASDVLSSFLSPSFPSSFLASAPSPPLASASPSFASFLSPFAALAAAAAPSYGLEGVGGG